ncbi:MAG: hypothetical protein BEN18_01515 [Epulopiscium sp. Nuni2H_MBin001]|nr:MAG: hypothetical protein BEN18_01515 [Epulopiscium sp. Nuni2H_MBin001]
MIRAIDTQTMYSQTPNIANSVQVTQEHAGLVQSQFTYLVETETKRRRETVVETDVVEHMLPEEDPYRYGGGDGIYYVPSQSGIDVAPSSAFTGSVGSFDIRI